MAAAGFTIRPADTPDRISMLKRLPPNHFVQRSHGGAVSYVYADPPVCNCLYVGNQQPYAQYRRSQQQQLANEQAMTAQLYSDPAWNWNGWGGGFGPGFGNGPGW